MSDFDVEKYVAKPIRLVKNTVSSNYTLSDSDSGGVVIIDSSSNDVTVTIPSDSTESIAIGTVIWLYRDGSNFVIVQGESGVTLNPDRGYIKSDKTEIYIRKQDNNKWVVGDLGGYQTFVSATGGTVSDITVNGVDYRVHAFTSVGTSTFNVTSGGEVNVLAVGGGGGGGATIGGGGGAGGFVYKEPLFVSPQTYSITVGDGGLGGYEYRFTTNENSEAGIQGDDTTAFGLTALGGGGGSGWNEGPGPTAGGSGGGGSASNSRDPQPGLQPGTNPTANIDAGNAGGNGDDGTIRAGGGGGGAGAPGEVGRADNKVGNGGIGLAIDITGTSQFYAGGGGGGDDSDGPNPNPGGFGGLGGGGRGGVSGGSATDPDVLGEDGAPNTGGGGGSGSYTGRSDNDFRIGGKGGSGIVIIRYRI